MLLTAQPKQTAAASCHWHGIIAKIIRSGLSVKFGAADHPAQQAKPGLESK